MSARQWTDPRDGREWSVEFFSGSAVGARGPGDYLPQSHPHMICFSNGSEHLCAPFSADKRLENLNDTELRGLLDKARSED